MITRHRFRAVDETRPPVLYPPRREIRRPAAVRSFNLDFRQGEQRRQHEEEDEKEERCHDCRVDCSRRRLDLRANRTRDSEASRPETDPPVAKFLQIKSEKEGTETDFLTSNQKIL